MTALLDEVAGEIERLHAFFEGWFQGTIPRDRFASDLEAAIHPAFENIQPEGTLLSREVLLEEIRGAYGSNPAFRIEIRAPRLLGHWPEAGLIMAGYVEAQFGARNTEPADNLRRSTALFERSRSALTWRHVHETALPATGA